ncbi:TRAP transporter small permease [Parasalinivibrio latis]|uniref:TRAP transporter small permease n=1 Tax=Parasalinivibrio latis TaxID=2952610 RepID=UPI0030E01013
MNSILNKISDWTEQLEKLIIIVSILAMMINSTVNAIGRYAFNRSLFFSEELNQFLIVSVTFVGFAYAVRKGRNIRMTAIYDMLNYRWKKVMMSIISILTALLMFYLAYYSVIYVMELKEINRLSPALQLPVFWIYAVIPVGFAIAGIQYISGFVMNVTHREIYVSFSKIESNTDG